ncbi:arsenate reductase, glutathione/glutaredoxin type [Okeania sp. SIO3I5]|uniref:arsenate reductase, glutathione/glutaredoxin type n=1 Tax=Okeania sp. SIO3I5 TaxID=2607805 RepID=UPI0025F940FC|nr:arsenate reductase, glutathione/glutaredoxin type [Okeania sp. SIO3I5]
MFVCNKNSARSQMAEAFANCLDQNGKFTFVSAGIEESSIHPLTIQVMSEVGIDISQQTSKRINSFNSQDFDVVASMCGCGSMLPPEWLMVEEFQEWQVADPEGNSIEIFRQAREEVKQQVEYLLMFLRLK